MCPKMLNAGVLIYLFLPWHHLITGSEGLAQPRVRSQRLHHRGGRGTGRRWPERRGPSSSSPGASTPGSPREKKHQLQGIPGPPFLGKDEPTWKIQLITNLNPSSTKLTQKIKRNIAATKKSSKISSKCSRMGAASNGTFTSNFSVTLIRQRALMAPLSSPGNNCRFNGLRPKFIGKDCAVPSPKKPGRKSERWDSGLANSVLDRSWIEMDGYYILDSAIYIYIHIYICIYIWYCICFIHNYI